MRLGRNVVVAILLVSAAFPASDRLQAADWPAWRYDAGRTAASAYELPGDLQLLWMNEYPAPHRAWMEPLNQERMPFDQCYEPIVAGKTLFFGSSREDCLVALDTDSGQERWRFAVDGPVRLPPAASDGKVVFACDDGFLYCVLQESGELLWRFRGGPSDRKLLGNERLISAWPARGGPVVVDGTVYFAAGIWPFMGVFVHAIDIESGEVVWTNDTSGAQFVLQPKRAPSFAGVGPQGAIAVNGDRLIVPGGRTVPAAFDRLTGELEYYHPEGYREDGAVTHRVAYRRLRYTGSSTVCTSGKFFFCDAYMFDVKSGADLKRPGKDRRVLDGDVMYVASNPVQAIDLTTFRPDGPKPERGIQEHTYDTLWTAPFIDNTTMIKAGSRLYAAGAGEVAALDPPTGGQPAKITWRARIEGIAGSVVAADDKLFVSTLEGRVYCFGPNPGGKTATTPAANDPPPTASSSPANADALKILKQSGVREGYCLVLGVPDAGMVATLAANTELRIHVVDSNRDDVFELREAMNRARLLPPRVCTLTADPYSEQLPPYLASLLVCNPLDSAGRFPDDSGTWLRSVFNYLRPYGGTACLKTSPSHFETLQKLVRASKLPNANLRYADGFALLTRTGPLPGAGSWTHNYADAGNTAVSLDSRVRLPLGVLWFGGSSHDATLPRHGRPPAPQALDGRIIVEGPDGLRAIDAFTGRVLWDAKLPGLGKFFNTVVHQPGALAVGGNYVTTHDGIYVAIDDRCVRLDPASGRTMAKYQLPPDSEQKVRPAWGYINVVGDYLIAGAEPAEFDGSEGVPGSHANHDFTASHAIVVLDRRSGDVLWQRSASFAYRHNVIAASSTTLFCVDSLSERDRTRLRRRGGKPGGEPQLLALDLATGKQKWTSSKDIIGEWLGYSAEHDVLLLSTSGRAVALRGASGEVLWTGNGSFGNYRPMIKGDTIIAQTTAFDLLTGQQESFRDPISGQPVPWSYTRNGEVDCTNAIACQNLITFRAGAVGHFDLERGAGMGTLGGFRPSCTNNIIAADGLLLAPDYTRTCKCAYQNQTSLALLHLPSTETWTEFAYETAMAPVEQIGINFGAPGDRLAEDGVMWIEYPLVGGRSPQLGISVEPESVTYSRVHESRQSESSFAWIDASAVNGLRRFRIDLIHDSLPATSRTYDIQLRFVASSGIKPGDSKCTVLVQGKPLRGDFDIATEDDGRLTVIRDAKAVRVDRELVVELRPSGTATSVPRLSGIRIQASDATRRHD